MSTSDPKIDNFALPPAWLRPYVAISLFHAPADISPFKKAESHFQLLLEETIRDRRRKGDRLRRILPVKPATHSGWRVSGFAYLQVSAPQWLKENLPEAPKNDAAAVKAYFDRFKSGGPTAARWDELLTLMDDVVTLKGLCTDALQQGGHDPSIEALLQLSKLLLGTAPENRPAMLRRFQEVVEALRVVKPLPAAVESLLRDWEETARIRESRYELALFCVREKFAAIACSDSRVRRGFRTRVLAERTVARADGSPLFHEIPEDIIASAYLRGNARQTWLEGLHAPVITKASSKTLLGPDLRAAIDPFGDQTFRLAGALSSLEEKIDPSFKQNLPANSPLQKLDPKDAVGGAEPKVSRKIVGISFDRAVVWTGASNGISEFLGRVTELCGAAEIAERERLTNPNLGFGQQGYQSLLVPERGVTADLLGNVVHFDFPLSLPGEDADTLEEEPEVLEANEAWLKYGDFRITNSDARCAYVDALFEGRKIGNIRLQPRIGGAGDADLEITTVSALPPDDKGRVMLDRILTSVRGRATLWFDQGFALRRQRVFKLHFRDVPFTGWGWLPFRGKPNVDYDLSEEKPFTVVNKKNVPVLPMKSHNWQGWSLFDFVVKNAASLFGFGKGSFLLCDDGSKEIADFIYVDPKQPRVVFVHVKATSGAASRDIAPGMYELVLQQAMKNTQFLDLGRLARALQEKVNTAAADLTWEGDGRGRTGNRAGAIKALKGMSALTPKTVVIFQPHVSRDVWLDYETRLRQDKLKPAQRIQHLRLKMLLAENQYYCGRMSAGFEVWGECDPAATGADVKFPVAQLA